MNEPSGEISLRLAGFEQFEEIGRGGFGIVYRAYQPALERSVAIKVLVGAAVDSRAQERFERERKTMGSLSSHPAIVTIFDSGLTADGVPYLVLELMEGGSLGDRITRDGPLPWPEAVAIGAKIADAVETAHRAGVVHRDLKPDNVLLSHYDEAKLTDFGIASLLDATGTRSGGITASVAHAAPEVLEGKRSTPRSDVYSLASTIFTLIAGQPAFTRPTDEGMTPVIARILTEDPPDLRPGVPDAVCRVLERGLAKNPDDRYESAAVMAQALRAAHDAPVLVAEPGHDLLVPSDATRVVVPPPADPQRRTRRTLVLAGVAAAVAVAVLVGVAVAGGGGGGTPGPGEQVAAGGTSTAGAKSGTGANPTVASTTTSSASTTSATSAITGSPSITSGTANSILGSATTVAPAATAATEVAAGVPTPTPSPAPPRAPSPPAPGPSPSPSPSPSPVPVPEPPAPTPAPAPAPTPPPPPPAPPTVPSVIGLDLNTALARLESVGFTNHPWEYNCYGGSTNGVVWSQSPSGVPADLSTAIILKLEAVNCEFVPSLIGLDQAGAIAQLNSLGFPYHWEYQCLGSPNIGAVVTQTPLAGADVVIDTTVSFYMQANNC